MNNGWLKLHRKMMEKGYYRNSQYVHLWIHLLFLAGHSNSEFVWNGKTIKLIKGQFITGRKQLSHETGIPETTVERVLKFFENEHQIGQHKTTKYRLITIINYQTYQNVDTKTDNRRTTDGQQTDTNKNLRIKEEREEDTSDVTSHEVVEVINSFKEVNPSYGKWFANKTQRGAISRMMAIHGKDQLLKVIGFLPRSNLIPYVPTVTTPLQLEEKWAQLRSGLEKQRSKLLEKKPVIV